MKSWRNHCWQEGNTICPSNLKLSTSAINARGFSFKVCTFLQKSEHQRFYNHSSRPCYHILSQCYSGDQLLWDFRNCTSRCHLYSFQCVQSMLKTSCACVLVLTWRDSRETDSLILHISSPPFTLSYLGQKYGA